MAKKIKQFLNCDDQLLTENGNVMTIKAHEENPINFQGRSNQALLTNKQNFSPEACILESNTETKHLP